MGQLKSCLIAVRTGLGIHQHGMLKHAATYEIMTPESVGIETGTEIVLGKHSGKAAYKARLIELGYADIANDEDQLQMQWTEATRTWRKWKPKKRPRRRSGEAILGFKMGSKWEK